MRNLIFLLVFLIILGFFIYVNTNQENHEPIETKTSSYSITNFEQLSTFLNHNHISFNTYLILKRRFCNDNNPYAFFYKSQMVKTENMDILLNVFRYRQEIFSNIVDREKLKIYLEYTYKNDIKHFLHHSGVTEYPIDLLKNPIYICEFVSNDSPRNKKQYNFFIKSQENFNINESFEASHSSQKMGTYEMINKKINEGLEKYGWYNYQKLTKISPEEAVKGLTN